MGLRIGIDGRFLSDRYPGIGRYLFNLLRALVPLTRDEEILVLTDPQAPNTRFDFTHLDGMELVPFPARPRTLGEQVALPRWCRRASLALFHTPYWWSAWRAPCPRVVTIYDLIPLTHREDTTLRSHLIAALFSAGARRAARIAHGVLTLSTSSRNELIGYLRLAEPGVTVTPAAADPAFHPGPPGEVETVLKRLEIRRPYLLYVGTQRPHKNVVRLVEAWARLSRAHPVHHLVIAGAPDRRYPQAADRAGQLGVRRLRFLGPVDDSDLPALYRGADLFVFPSLHEGLGLPVLEAMACGTAVACSRIPSLQEVAGEAAFFFDPRSVDGLAHTLDEALTRVDLRRQRARQGLGRAREFSWRETARRTLAVYRQVAGGGP